MVGSGERGWGDPRDQQRSHWLQLLNSGMGFRFFLGECIFEIAEGGLNKHWFGAPGWPVTPCGKNVFPLCALLPSDSLLCCHHQVMADRAVCTSDVHSVTPLREALPCYLMSGDGRGAVFAVSCFQTMTPGGDASDVVR